MPPRVGNGGRAGAGAGRGEKEGSDAKLILAGSVLAVLRAHLVGAERFELRDSFFEGHGRDHPSLEPGQAFSLCGAEEPVVADLGESLGQDMLEEAADELVGVESGPFPLAGAGFAATEGDLPVLELFDPAVGEGDPIDIGCQVAESLFAASFRTCVFSDWSWHTSCVGVNLSGGILAWQRTRGKEPARSGIWSCRLRLSSTRG